MAYMNNCFKSSMDVGDMANYGAIVVGGTAILFLVWSFVSFLSG